MFSYEANIVTMIFTILAIVRLRKTVLLLLVSSSVLLPSNFFVGHNLKERVFLNVFKVS